jgi:hypothetical protein
MMTRGRPGQATLDGYAKSQTVDDVVYAIDALHATASSATAWFLRGGDVSASSLDWRSTGLRRRHPGEATE